MNDSYTKKQDILANKSYSMIISHFFPYVFVKLYTDKCTTRYIY